MRTGRSGQSRPLGERFKQQLRARSRKVLRRCNRRRIFTRTVRNYRTRKGTISPWPPRPSRPGRDLIMKKALKG